jgi:C-terminal peptidase prc
MDEAIDAMVTSLDPYTVYYPESRVEDLRFMTTGEYGGVGATIQQLNGKVTIVDVYPGFPAAEAGLRIGDVIVSVGGRKVDGLNTDQVSEMLQGATGTGLELRYRRPGEAEDRYVALTREKIKMPAVPYRGMVDEVTGYVILSAFTQGSAGELRQAIRYLTDSAGAKQIVLDLRGNGGGLLNESVSIANLFLPKELEVVSTRGKVPEWTKVYKTFADPVVPNLPVAVLIDGISASASEIVAGALQDHDRAIIVGEASYGKGLVQQNKDLAYGTKLKVAASNGSITAARKMASPKRSRIPCGANSEPRTAGKCWMERASSPIWSSPPRTWLPSSKPSTTKACCSSLQTCGAPGEPRSPNRRNSGCLMQIGKNSRTTSGNRLISSTKPLRTQRSRRCALPPAKKVHLPRIQRRCWHSNRLFGRMHSRTWPATVQKSSAPLKRKL